MDWLLEIRDGLEKRVFDSLVTLLNLEADVLHLVHVPLP